MVSFYSRSLDVITKKLLFFLNCSGYFEVSEFNVNSQYGQISACSMDPKALESQTSVPTIKERTSTYRADVTGEGYASTP